MKHLIIISLLIPLTAHADIYKCTTPSGAVEFQAKPCDSNEKSNTVKIQKYPKSTHTPNYYQSSPTTQYNKEIIKEYKKQNKLHNKRIDKYDRQDCARYTGYYEDEVKKLERLRKRGYTQKERDWREDRVETAKREMNIRCE